MSGFPTAPGFRRRARPLLGTLVEVGLAAPRGGAGPDLTEAMAGRAFEAAFGAVQAVALALSRFDAASDLSRCQALPPGQRLRVHAPTRRVLAVARLLQRASQGAFDISLGSGPDAWHCEGGQLWRDAPGVFVDAGGIAKGYAVDCAVRALRSAGCTSGWVNAGGDLRVFGDLTLPIHLRDERLGGVRAWGDLSDGAMATSHFGPGSRSVLAGGMSPHAACHVSVVAPRCLWADALTKVLALTGDLHDPLLARFGAHAFLH